MYGKAGVSFSESGLVYYISVKLSSLIQFFL